MNERLTPETDAMVAADQHHLEDDNFFPATVYWRMCDLARTLERQRDDLMQELTVIRTVASYPHHPNALQAIQFIAKNAIAAVKGGDQ